MTKPAHTTLPEAARLARALGDPQRLRALAMLREGELCLCQIIEVLELAPSTVSKHMSILLEAGFVTRRKEGRWHYYSLLTGRGVEPALRTAGRWAMNMIDDDPRISSDARRLKRVRCADPWELTECYRTTNRL